MKKLKFNKIDRTTSPFGRYLMVCVSVLCLCSAAVVMILFRTNTVLNVDDAVGAANILKIQPSATSVSVSRSLLEQQSAGGASAAIGSGEVGSFDQSVYDKLMGGGYGEDKSLAMTYAWCTFSGKYSPEFALGVMANIKAEGAPGVVEHAFSKSHAHGFCLPSGKSEVQDAADVEYLKAWDSTSEVKDKGVKKGSCGFGMAQMSFGRRVRLCDAYLANVTDYKDKHQLAIAEIAYIDAELAEGGAYDNVPKKCAGKSAEECAKIVCTDFESPAHEQSQAVIRSGYISKLKRVMGVN